MNKKLFYFNLSITVFILIFVKTTNAVTVYESSEYSYNEICLLISSSLNPYLIHDEPKQSRLSIQFSLSRIFSKFPIFSTLSVMNECHLISELSELYMHSL
ncbi:hypothetical protein H8356DRAFT_1431667 [Neocallimastix lanati (nom. inval.)]|nr:hypothetical protein H8356DRAFT_1431667 [Neocallimastix sp. JGI-2020a]